VGWQRGEKSVFSGIKKIGNNKKWQFKGARTLPDGKIASCNFFIYEFLMRKNSS